MNDPFNVRRISVAARALAAGWTTADHLQRIFEPDNLKAVRRLAKAVVSAGSSPEPFDPADAGLDVQIAAHLLAQDFSTPALLAASMLAAYPPDARAALLEAADGIARKTRTWAILHPGEDRGPKSKADRDADILGKPRPADPRALGADAPTLTPLQKAARDDPELGRLLDRAREIAARPYDYESATAMAGVLREIEARPDGNLVLAELQAEERGALERANDAADQRARDNQIRALRGTPDAL